jgi:oxygen-independent coproporphyrinogen-3 oxidase
MSSTRLRGDLLSRYGTRPIPRYTSYPSANVWNEQQDEDFARRALAGINRPLSLYVHVPFCKKLCFYCGCNMLVSHQDALVERYLAALEFEVDRVARFLPERREVVQLHLGGGTPTHLSTGQLERLAGLLRRHFSWSRDVEASIEVHPPVTTEEQLRALARLGFNRLSMGVQPFEQTRDLIDQARRHGFISVNVDLMYGLPLQNVERFSKTLDRIEQLRPDRIALFGYAHMPRLKKHQRVLRTEDLPTAEGRLALFELGLERLERAGYVSIGLDHFALAHDELAIALGNGSLRRNFMGYTTCASSDVVAFGPSAISEVEGTYVQNAHDVRQWAASLEAGRLAVSRGWSPSKDDNLRRRLIMRLFCQLEVDLEAFGRDEGVDFEQYFRPELGQLRELERDGLVERQGGLLKILPQGQLLLRNVAAVFDAYLQKPLVPRHHSQAV